MSFIYNYNVVTSFINDIVNLDSLTIEIESSSINKELDYISVDLGICSIIFEEELTQQDLNSLNLIVSTHTGIPPNNLEIFTGINFSTASSDKESSTNSTNFVNKVNVVTESLESGIYRIGWYYEWRRDSVSDSFLAAVVLDDSTIIMDHNEETKDSNSWHTESGFIIIDLSFGEHKINLYYAGSSSRNTSFIRRARLELWRVG